MTLQPFESEIGKQFRSVVKGTNLMTPGITGYVWLKDGIAEISYGKFMSSELWGVTIIINDIKRDELSKSFNSVVDVEKYIKKLNREDFTPLTNLFKLLDIS